MNFFCVCCCKFIHVINVVFFYSFNSCSYPLTIKWIIFFLCLVFWRKIILRDKKEISTIEYKFILDLLLVIELTIEKSSHSGRKWPIFNREVAKIVETQSRSSVSVKAVPLYFVFVASQSQWSEFLKIWSKVQIDPVPLMEWILISLLKSP